MRPLTARRATAIAGLTAVSLSGTAFAADDSQTSAPSTHEAHAAHLAHRAHAAHKAGTAAPRRTTTAASRATIRTRLTHHTTATTSTTASSGWALPVPAGTGLSQGFGTPNSRYAAGYHTGLDFAVSTGTPLYAVGKATVVSAGWAGAYGNCVVLRLSDGHYALYGHISSLAVSAGQTVSAGQRIGRSGGTGNATGPHLHFEIRTVNSYGAVIDPLSYLRSKAIDV